MCQRAAGAHRGGDDGRLRQFLPARAGAQRPAGMNVDAIFALAHVPAKWIRFADKDMRQQ
jgi:hypothetical protein